MSSRLVAFRPADPLLAAQSRARVLRLEVEQRAFDEIESRRRALTELGQEVADELSVFTLDQLEARLRALTQPAGRGAYAAAGVAGEGGGACPGPAPLPLVLHPQPTHRR